MSPIATHLKVLRKIHSLNLELAIPILARPEAGEPQGPSCLHLPHSLTLVLGLWMCAEPSYFMSAGDTNSDSHAHAATTLPTEPSPGSKVTMWKKDGMTHIWRSTLPIGCELTRGATDYGIFHFISHWEQVSKAAHKPAGGPCPHLLPLEPELIVSLQTSLGSQQRGSSSEILPQRVYSLPGWNLGYFESLVLANSIL